MLFPEDPRAREYVQRVRMQRARERAETEAAAARAKRIADDALIARRTLDAADVRWIAGVQSCDRVSLETAATLRDWFALEL